MADPFNRFVNPSADSSGEAVPGISVAPADPYTRFIDDSANTPYGKTEWEKMSWARLLGDKTAPKPDVSKFINELKGVGNTAIRGIPGVSSLVPETEMGQTMKEHHPYISKAAELGTGVAATAPLFGAVGAATPLVRGPGAATAINNFFRQTGTAGATGAGLNVGDTLSNKGKEYSSGDAVSDILTGFGGAGFGTLAGRALGPGLGSARVSAWTPEMQATYERFVDRGTPAQREAAILARAMTEGEYGPAGVQSAREVTQDWMERAFRGTKEAANTYMPPWAQVITAPELIQAAHYLGFGPVASAAAATIPFTLKHTAPYAAKYGAKYITNRVNPTTESVLQAMAQHAGRQGLSEEPSLPDYSAATP